MNSDTHRSSREPSTHALFVRLVEALERLAPPAASSGLEVEAEGYLWRADAKRVEAVPHIARVPLFLLRGIDRQRETLLANTRAFAAGRPANNALLWGARGTGKSSLAKAVHGEVNDERVSGQSLLSLIEVQRDDIGTLGRLLSLLATEPARRFIIFCDDLSFDAGEADYKSLKAVLDGSLAGRPANVIIYATSNRRHLLAREMVENERSTAIHASEAVEEKVSLSDRFGLWLGFHNAGQDGFLDIVQSYADEYRIPIEAAQINERALQWAAERGSRSGRTAWQFVVALRESLPSYASGHDLKTD